MNFSFLISLHVLYIILYCFIAFVCFIKLIFEKIGGNKFSVVRLEICFFITFLVYNLLYLFFVFSLFYSKHKLFKYDTFIFDKTFITFFLMDLYSNLDIYFLLVFISFGSSCLFLSLNINKNLTNDREKLFYFSLYFLIYFIYFFLIFSFTFFLIIIFLK